MADINQNAPFLANAPDGWSGHDRALHGHNRPAVTGYNSFRLSIKARIAAGMWRRLG
jgi:hypothetical protein